MTQTAYLRYPHIHGELATFTAEDDVWVAPLDGGRAWRVSADNVPVNHPRISPDGTTVAWTSTRDGAPEVHVAPVDGGPSKRLTHWGTWKTGVRGWTPDGQVLAVSAAGQASWNRSWARAVPLDGGPAATLPYGLVGNVTHGPDGQVLLVTAPLGREAAWWKRYRGGTAGKLWLREAADTEFVRLHEELDGNIEYPLWVGERLAFLSDHEGVGALYSSLPDGSDLRRHTPLDGFYARHAATDGTRVIYTSAGRLWLLDDLTGAEPRRLDIRLGGQRTDLQPHPVSAARWFGAAAPDHTGRGSAVSVRGSVHWVTHREGPARALAATPGVRARLPRTFRVAGEAHDVWVTTRRATRRWSSPRPPAPRPALPRAGSPPDSSAGSSGSPCRRTAAAPPSPRTTGASCSSSGRAARSARSTAARTATSPGSSSRRTPPGSPGHTPARARCASSNSPTPPTCRCPRRPRCASATIRPRSRSTASTSPSSPPAPSTRSTTSTSSTSPSSAAPARTSSRSPRPRRPRSGRSGTAGPSRGRTAPAPRRPTARARRHRVDFDGLADRIVAFPVEAARYTTLRAAKDGLLWLRHPVRGVLGASRATPSDPEPHTELERYDLAQRRVEELAADADHFAVTGDGKRVLLWTDGKLKVVPSDRRASGDEDSDSNISVDLTRIRHTVDPAAEWRQMYDETGRLMRDNFWRPTWAASTGTAYWSATARCSTASPPTTTSSTCSGRCRASWAPRTRTSSRAAGAAAPRSGKGFSAPTCRGARTACGASTASCPRRPPTPRRAPRWRPPASRSAPATR